MSDELCNSPSTYCEDGAEWTYHCVALSGHEPGQHDYELDAGQTPPTEGVAE